MSQQNEMPTLDQVLTLVEQLPLADQARLVELVLPRLTQALAAEPEPIEAGEMDAAAPEAFAELIALGERLAHDWPAGVTSAHVLSSLRDER